MFVFNHNYSRKMSVMIKCSVYLDVKDNRSVLSMRKFPRPFICVSLVPIPHQTESRAPKQNDEVGG